MNDFAASPGQVGDLSSSGLKNEFSNLPGNNVDSAFNSDRVQPRQVATGVTRGAWRINDPDGSYIIIGEIPNTNGQLGIAYFDANNNLISKDTGATRYRYDDTGTQISIDGRLDDGDYGLQFSDGTVTTTIKAGEFVQNDGTTDRLFLGNE